MSVQKLGNQWVFLAAEKQIHCEPTFQPRQTIYTTVCIQPKLTVLYHLGLLKDTGGLPKMKSPNDTALGTHLVITGHRTACWETESEKGDVAFSLWWGTPQHWSCSDMQPERPRERWVWGRQWANCTPNALSSEVTAKVIFYVLSISFRIQQGRAQALSSGGSAQIPAFLMPIVKARLLALSVHSPQWGRFTPALSRHGEDLEASPMLVTFLSLPWFSAQPRLWDKSHYPYYNKEPQAQKVPPTCIINSTQSHGIGKLTVKWSSHLVTLS